MAVNKRKVLEAARKCAQKGAKQKALKEYNTLLRLDARDAKLRLEVGDAHRRWGESDEAIGHYTKVADQYVQDGFDARAVAVFKQILNLDPKRYAAYVSLSDLYQRMGLESEAVAALQTAADGYHKEGQKREALELLRKMAQLDPTNTTSRLKVAELLQKEGLEGDAVAEYESIAKELLQQGEAGQAENVYQRVLALEPKRVDILVTLARNSIEQRAPERAESWARRAVDVEENEVALELLCDVYKALENTEGLIGATKRLAKIYRERGDENEARTIMQRLPSVESIDGREDVAGAAPLEAGGGAAGLGEDEFLGDDELLGDDAFLADDGSDVFEFDDDDSLDLAVAPPASLDEASASASSQAEVPTGDPEQLLAEASVYLRYGKLEQAIANLRGILLQEPGHRGALEKLGEALAETGDTIAAVGMWTQAAERAREENDAASFEVLCGRVGTLDAAAATRIPPMEPVDDGLYDSDLTVDEGASADAGDDLSIDLDLDDEAFDALSQSSDSDSDCDSDADSASATANAGSATAAKVSEELEEAEFFFDQGMLDEAAQVYERVLAIVPNHPSAMLRMGEIAERRGESAGDSLSLTGDGAATLQEDALDLTVDIEEELLPDPAAESQPTLVADSPPPAAPETSDEIELSFDDDGDDVDESVQARAPELVAAPIESAPPLQEPPAPVAVHDDDSFDLAAELSGVIDGDPQEASSDGRLGGGTEEEAFATLFDSFKQGVSEVLEEGDYETRYDLAIAYKEMGLMEDAVSAFQACVACPSRGLDSLQLLAQCALDLGRVSDAIGHLEQALSWPEMATERRAGLHFDLARAFTASGDLPRARTTYETVTELSPGYPGLDAAVAELIERANSDSGAAAADEAAEDASSEIFESFDDLVAEATAEEVLQGVQEAPASEPEPADSLQAAEAWIEAEPDPEPIEPADEAMPEPEAKTRKRKKKISFV